MKMQVVIPMGGIGQRFLNAGYQGPKPLLDVEGQPLIRRLLDVFPRDWRFVFPCNREHLANTQLKKVLLEASPNAIVVPIQPHKLGPVQSVLEAIDHIDDKLPTIVNYCDFSFSWSPTDFCDFVQRTQCDGAVFCYRGFHPHYLGNTLYAYCREQDGVIKEIKEKGHFTPDRTQEFASSGTYYFSSGRVMKDAFTKAKAENLSTNGEYYVSLVYNPLINAGKTIRIYEIPFMLQWGTPEDLEDYTYWHRTFDAFTKHSQPRPNNKARLLMPMAGFGTRFTDSLLPKPLIPVLGQPMYETAIRFLPCRDREPIFVIREGLEIKPSQTGARTVKLSAPTRGQAETVLKGLSQFGDDEPVFVSACDHGLLWNDAQWDALIASAPDVVVVGQRHYPGARRTPKSFAYIEADTSKRIKRVSVKQPISDKPSRDLLLVGTFYFKKKSALAAVINQLIQNDQRVNGEFYLDSVINNCVERGQDVRLFESTAYLNWGSPDALKEFSYWHQYFTGTSS